MDDERSRLIALARTAGESIFLGHTFQEFYSFTLPLIESNLQNGDRMLDLGCSDGRLAIHLLQASSLSEVVGVDIRQHAVATANELSQHLAAKFHVADAEDVDRLSGFGRFNVVLARTVLHHFADPLEGMRKLVSILRPGGRLVVIDIDRESACWDILGFPLTLLITWVVVVRRIGLRAGLRAIRDMKYPSQAWREHRAADVANRRRIGWYRWRDIRKKLHSKFPSAECGRIGSFCGLGGVHFIVYEVPQDDR